MKTVLKWTLALVIQVGVMLVCYHAGFQDGYDVGDHQARTERANVINACWDQHHNDIYGCYISN